MSKREKYYGKEGFWIISVFGIMCIIFMTIYTMFIFKEVARQNMIFFGTVEKAMDYRTSANLVNLIFSSQNKSDLYYNGIQLMKKAGYENSYATLIFLPYQKLMIFNIYSAIIMIFTLIILGKTQKKQSQKEEFQIILYLKKHVPIKKNLHFFSENFLESIEKIRKDIDKQQQIHIEYNEKIMHYMEDVSHQLKTPLSVMRMICEKIEMRYSKFSVEMGKCLGQIDYMTDTIRDLINLGKFDCKKFQMKFEEISAEILMETVVNDIEILAEPKNIEISVQGKLKIKWLCDPFWMQEVLKNILKNCIEHSPNGKIEIFYGIEKNLNKIIIRDNGQGFMFGRENKIFERYFLGDRTKEGSSGLGLSIAQQVIKQHFGTITASNRECGGAEFLILFPQMDATTIY